MFSRFARPVWACLALLVLVSFSPASQAGTRVRVCPGCTTEAQVGNDAWTWGRANIGHYGVFIDTTPAPYTIRRCFQRIYQPHYGVDTIMSLPMSNCPDPEAPLNEPADVMDTSYYTSNRYYAKVADFNSDGRLDLFVTGQGDRAVPDFLVLQQPDWKFTIAATPTAAQVQLAASAPVTSVTVVRTDYTSDGVLDFEFLNVDEAIPGAPGIIVLTQKWNGTPKAAVARDARFEQLANALEAILGNFDQMAGLWRTSYCNIFTIYLSLSPPFYLDRPYAGFVEGEWSWGGTNWGYRPYVQQACFSGSMVFSPEGREMMGAVMNFQGPAASEARAAQIVEQILTKVRIQVSIGRALVIRTAAVEASAVIIADDVSIVGVADDWGLIITAAMIGYTVWEVNRYTELLNQQIGEDEGVNPQPAAQPDPYATKSGCNPWNAAAGQTAAAVGRPSPKQPASWRLRSNLEKTGCGCPQGNNTNAAHHIIEKGGSTPDVIAARQCLSTAGIDVDWAGNGICLPTNDNAPTNAFKHSQIHSGAYSKAMRKLCEDSYAAGGSTGVQNMLNEVRGLLSRGQQFW